MEQITIKPQEEKSALDSLFPKIKTKEDALKQIKDASYIFYAFAVFGTLFAFFLSRQVGLSSLDFTIILSGIILIILAFVLRKFNPKNSSMLCIGPHVSILI